MLIVAQTSKKLKSLYNLVRAEDFGITAIQDIWLVDSGKANTALKTQIKKATDTKKKVLEKIKKTKEKEKAILKEKILQMRKLVVSNCKAQIDTFKVLLSNLSIMKDFHSCLIKNTLIFLFNSLSSATPVAAVHLAYETYLQTKMFVLKSLVQRLGGTIKVKIFKKREYLYLFYF